jgi:hypothetical protein
VRVLWLANSGAGQFDVGVFLRASVRRHRSAPKPGEQAEGGNANRDAVPRVPQPRLLPADLECSDWLCLARWAADTDELRFAKSFWQLASLQILESTADGPR